MPMQLEKYKFSNAAMETANQSTAGYVSSEKSLRDDNTLIHISVNNF